MADRDAPFSASDTGGDLPMRRFLVAGHAGGLWLIAIEQGGRGYSVQVYEYEGTARQHQWSIPTRSTTLHDIVQQLPLDR
ncbi:hypothetical protein ACVWWW_001841 [Lysobacter sp. HA18]